MNKHTPGPWHVESMIDYGRDIYAGDRWIGQANNDHGTDINESGFPSNSECDANASLIAAAPDLLEALEVIIRDGRLQTFEDREKCRAIARAAIAKARGE